MIHDRSDAAHFAWQEAEQRLDYFLAGVAAALVGYLGQALTVTAFGLNRGTGELVAVSFFILAFLASVRRIEQVTLGQRLNSSRLFHAEAAAETSRASQEGELQVSFATSELFLPDHLLAASRGHSSRVDQITTTLEQSNAKALCWYRARNAFLILGFVALVVARLLELAP